MRCLLITPPTDWKKLLPKKEREVLKSLLSEVRKYERFYVSSSNPELAQLWCALLLLKKQIEELREKLRELGPDNRRALKGKEVEERSKREEIKRIMERF